MTMTLTGKLPGVVSPFFGSYHVLDEGAIDYNNGRFSSSKTINSPVFGHIYGDT